MFHSQNEPFLCNTSLEAWNAIKEFGISRKSFNAHKQTRVEKALWKAALEGERNPIILKAIYTLNGVILDKVNQDLDGLADKVREQISTAAQNARPAQKQTPWEDIYKCFPS